MDIQTSFDTLIQLLKGQENPIVLECISESHKRITFSSFQEIDSKVPKEQILSIYKIRAEIQSEREGDPFVLGYEDLLPALRNTNHEYIGVASITSDKGAYIIFCDHDMVDFIGILKSKRTLTEIEKTYSDHKGLVEQSGHKIQYDYESNKNEFLDGKYVSK